MLRKMIFLSLLGLVFLPGPLMAGNAPVFIKNIFPDSIVGTISAVGRDTLEVYDEGEKRTKRFVYLFNGVQFITGERVRIFFNSSSGAIELIKKVTPLEYEKGVRNLGYLYKKGN